MRPRAEAVLVGVAVLWASTFVVTKELVREVAPLAFLSVRFGIAAVILIAWKRRAFADKRLLIDGIVLGVLNSTGLALQVFGQAFTTIAKSSFITSLNTPLTPLFALALYRTRASRSQLLAIMLATVGLALLTWPGAGARWNAGDLFTIGCAAMYAFTIVEIARRSPRHPDALGLTAVQVVTAAAFFMIIYAIIHILPSLPGVLSIESRGFHPTPLAWAWIVYMALVCTVVTFAGQTWAMARMSATTSAIIFSLEPVFATTMALAIGGAGEWPGARGATGAALVMIGVLVSVL
jgi:drug/metabolite transporter (DMT)-like permease